MIWFRKEHPKYGCFSNFHYSPINMEGEVYDTVEHFYQAMKAKTIEEHEFIREATTPHEARKRGKNCELRDGWEEMKENIMRDAVLTKFTQHEDLKEILLSTEDEELIEWAPWDKYWGKNDSGQGQNRLGAILMETREKLKNPA